jgi:uncharacterized protein YdhG (YjbR/CyaY superfamily)
MQSKAIAPEQYLKELPADRKQPMTELRNTVLKNLPKGFEERMTYGMIGYVVPHEIYPAGYHCDPKLPLGMINIGSQKNFLVMHHMGLYANPELLKWFVTEYPKHAKTKLDMGKGCVRFKKMDDIPYKLIGELIKKVSVKNWIESYEKAFRMAKKKS